ncbi:MAG: phage tail protein [Mucispirillum sp.]|nr:phage tail protein [Mucispirillum sp.]
MSYKYFTVLTDVGKQKLAEAIANETALDFTEMAVGDSNGTSYEPTSDMTALKHVTYRAAIGSMKINAEDKNIMEFEFVVPASTGGFYIREAGLYSSDGTLIAISRLPEQYKADMAEGAGSSMTVRILVAISSDAQIYITVPASITYATKTYVTEEFKKHKAEENPHTQYVLNETYSDKIDELQEDIDSKAASNHNHDGTYSKTNHTHSNYALTSHNHDSIYLKKTDASSTYATKKEMNNGLAGKAVSNHNHDSTYLKKTDASSTYASKYHNHKEINREEIFPRFDIFSPVTTQQLVTKIIGLVSWSKMFSEWINKSNPVHITDLPENIMYLEITVIDINGLFLEARAPFGNNSLWVGSVNNGVFGGWQRRY